MARLSFAQHCTLEAIAAMSRRGYDSPSKEVVLDRFAKSAALLRAQNGFHAVKNLRTGNFEIADPLFKKLDKALFDVTEAIGAILDSTDDPTWAEQSRAAKPYQG